MLLDGGEVRTGVAVAPGKGERLFELKRPSEAQPLAVHVVVRHIAIGVRVLVLGAEPAVEEAVLTLELLDTLLAGNRRDPTPISRRR